MRIWKGGVWEAQLEPEEEEGGCMWCKHSSHVKFSKTISFQNETK